MNLKEQVLERVHAEQEQYAEEICKQSGANVYERAYEICYRNEFICVLETAEFSDEEYKKILKFKNILYGLYDLWMEADCSVCDMLEDVIKEGCSNV